MVPHEKKRPDGPAVPKAPPRGVTDLPPTPFMMRPYTPYSTRGRSFTCKQMMGSTKFTIRHMWRVFLKFRKTKRSETTPLGSLSAKNIDWLTTAHSLCWLELDIVSKLPINRKSYQVSNREKTRYPIKRLASKAGGGAALPPVERVSDEQFDMGCQNKQKGVPLGSTVTCTSFTSASHNCCC